MVVPAAEFAVGLADDEAALEALGEALADGLAEVAAPLGDGLADAAAAEAEAGLKISQTGRKSSRAVR